MFTRFKNWLLEPENFWNWLLWWAWVVVFICWAFPDHWIHRTIEDRIKWCGMIFELGALLTAWQAINDLRSDFGLPSWRELLCDWLKRFRGIFKRPVNIVVNATAGAFGVSGSGSVGTVVTRAKRTIEDRIDAVEKQLSALENRLGSEIARVLAEAKTLIESEHAERKARVSRLASR